MKCLVIFVAFAFVVRFTQALKCRTESGPKEEQMAEIMKHCMQNGASQDGGAYVDHDDSARNGKPNEENSYESSRPYRSTTAALKRNRRQSSNSNTANRNQYATGNSGSQGKQNASQFEQLQSDNSTYNFSSDAAGACMVQCVLQEMKMTGEAGLPDRNMMKNVMTNKVKETELKEFLQESIDECFQLLESDNSNREKCAYSKDLMSCMSERGKSQCDDWQETQNMHF